MKLRYLALLIALFSSFSSANAQHPLILNRLNGWNEATPIPHDATMKAQVRAKAREIYGATAACSDSETIIDEAKPATADRYAFNALIRGTIKNAWFITVRMPGCDPAPVRYMVTQNTDNSLETIRVNRGISYAWESLLGDTIPSAQLAAMAAFKKAGVNCSAENKPSLEVIRISSKEPDLGADTFGIRYSGSWTEVWPLTLCERTAEVVIRFTADGDGGALTHISGDKTRVVP